MRSPWITPVLVAAISLMGAPALADGLARTVTVVGEGKATAPPDMATINTGVVTEAAHAGEALAANNTAMEKIMEVLRKQHVAAKDIQTTSFQVRPTYEPRPQRGTPPKIVGYRVTNQVRVRVRNLPELGEVLDALVSAGSNRVSGISFGIDDPTGVLNQARNRAVADARSRATLYAQAAGVVVGKVIRISEQAIAVPVPRFQRMALAAAEASSVPVATGEQELRATVHMVFALEDAN